MEWLRIGLAAIVTTAISYGAMELLSRRSKRREVGDPIYSESEKRRALGIVTDLGTFVVSVIQLVAGLAVGILSFALLIFLVTATELPKLDYVLVLSGMFVAGGIAAAWCQRITGALNDK